MINTYVDRWALGLRRRGALSVKTLVHETTKASKLTSI
jgi:hypothetical protein